MTEMALVLHNKRILSCKTWAYSPWDRELITLGNLGEEEENSILYPALTQGDDRSALPLS